MKRTPAALIAILLAFALTGCAGGNKIVPRSKLTPQKQKEIREFIRNADYRAARDSTREVYGSDAVPFMIERVIEIYNLGPDFKYPQEYSIANNLILSLGDIGDTSAMPALELWLTEIYIPVDSPAFLF